MYKCDKCQTPFDTPDANMMCPCCHGENYNEVHECADCGKLVYIEERIYKGKCKECVFEDYTTANGLRFIFSDKRTTEDFLTKYLKDNLASSEQYIDMLKIGFLTLVMADEMYEDILKAYCTVKMDFEYLEWWEEQQNGLHSL